MKKNKMMRTASGLLALTLLTTGVISGTFAKYTTEDSAYDVARVAKWGVTLQATGSLYGDKYADKAGGNTPTDKTDGISVRGLQLSNTENNDQSVVAPGTESNGGFSFTLNGKPEVKTTTTLEIKSANVKLAAGQYGVMVAVPKGKVTKENFSSLDTLYTLNGTKYTVASVDDFDPDADTTYYTLEDYVNNEKDYYPVVYELTGDTNYSKDYTENTMDEISKKIAQKVSQVTNGINPQYEKTETAGKGAVYTASVDLADNTDLTKVFALNDENISWKWAFENDDATIGNTAKVHDKADTILGNLMAEEVKDFTGEVVTGNDTDGFDKIEVKEENIIVTNANGGESKNFKNFYAVDANENVVANLSTYFSIDITVTQVD